MARLFRKGTIRRPPELLLRPERDPFIAQLHAALKREDPRAYRTHRRYTLPHQRGVAYVVWSMLPELRKDFTSIRGIDETKFLRTAYLHDTGKFGATYLTDPRVGLTGWQEFEQHRHPINGVERLQSIPNHERHIDPENIMGHHMWFGGEARGGGRSYPQERETVGGVTSEVKGDRIPLQTRIITVADAVDAMRGGGRRYRRVLSLAETFDELVNGARKGQFDPRVVRAFLNSRIRDPTELERQRVRLPTLFKDLRGYVGDLVLQYPIFGPLHKRRKEVSIMKARASLGKLDGYFPGLAKS